jgi:hypothetical protein
VRCEAREVRFEAKEWKRWGGLRGVDAPAHAPRYLPVPLTLALFEESL